MTQASIVVAGLTVDRGGQRVLDAFDLEVHAGRITGLIGPSGCGKTTLMRAIAGTQRIAAGSVTVLGEPAGSASLRRRIAYVTQAHSYYRDLTVRENVEYFASVYGVARIAATAAIEAVNLGGLADRVTAEMSGGQQSRVALATALVADPEVLILDEPTVGLDPVLRRDLWRMFADFAAEGKTVLVSSHVMDEADRCDDLVLMREGAVLAHGSPAELRSSTGAHDLEAAFLALIEEGAR